MSTQYGSHKDTEMRHLDSQASGSKCRKYRFNHISVGNVMTLANANRLKPRWEVRYKDYVGKTWDLLLSNPEQHLPVRRENHLEWVKWGRRPSEDMQGFTIGGMVRQESLQVGKWKQFIPEKVHLHLSEFSEPGKLVPMLFFDVPERYAILGIIAHWHGEKRVYIVTTNPPRGMEWHKDGWPVIVPATWEYPTFPKNKMTVKYCNIQKIACRYTEKHAEYYNARGEYSGLAYNLLNQAGKHTFANPRTYGLDLSKYVILNDCKWVLNFVTLKKFMSNYNSQDIMLLLGEKLWRAKNGWTILCLR